jgi:hypothetical protein
MIKSVSQSAARSTARVGLLLVKVFLYFPHYLHTYIWIADHTTPTQFLYNNLLYFYV